MIRRIVQFVVVASLTAAIAAVGVPAACQTAAETGTTTLQIRNNALGGIDNAENLAFAVIIAKRWLVIAHTNRTRIFVDVAGQRLIYRGSGTGAITVPSQDQTYDIRGETELSWTVRYPNGGFGHVRALYRYNGSGTLAIGSNDAGRFVDVSLYCSDSQIEAFDINRGEGEMSVNLALSR
jgi:hypothetical protein